MINGLGAACTAVASGVILAAKLTAAAWIVVMILPALLALLPATRRHYDAVARQVGRPLPLDLPRNEPPVAVVQQYALDTSRIPR